MRVAHLEINFWLCTSKSLVDIQWKLSKGFIEIPVTERHSYTHSLKKHPPPFTFWQLSDTIYHYRWSTNERFSHCDTYDIFTNLKSTHNCFFIPDVSKMRNILSPEVYFNAKHIFTPRPSGQANSGCICSKFLMSLSIFFR